MEVFVLKLAEKECPMQMHELLQCVDSNPDSWQIVCASKVFTCEVTSSATSRFFSAALRVVLICSGFKNRTRLVHA